MTDPLKLDIAAALEATPEQLPFIPELLADLWVLGASLDIILELLRPLRLPRSTRVLDAGSGKGAVAITLAQQFGFQVLGIDGFPPFVDEARKQAEARGVSHLCRFEFGDLREALPRQRDFDVVIYAALGGILGTVDQCVGLLRHSVRSGGYLVIDDGFLAGTERIPEPGYETYVPHDETLTLLTAHGDEILREVIVAVDDIREVNRLQTALIRKRAEGLSRQHPDAAASIAQYVERQDRECTLLETEVVGAVWLLQRC
ncbi:MAG: methyltransferase domain-containing protein [Gemmatimonadales bacterium]|nr:methyltransferase domain-containing protein [Gemmatimonadales bacterium]